MPDSPTLAPIDLSLTYEEIIDAGDVALGDGLVPRIGPGTGFGRVLGAIGGFDEVFGDFIDSYQFTAPDDALSLVSITLESTEPENFGFLSGSLYSADGRFITAISALGDLFPTTLFAGIGESYVIEVSDFGADSSTPYELTISFSDADTGDTLSGTAPIGDAPDSVVATIPTPVGGDSYNDFREITGNVGADDDAADFFGFQSLTDATALISLQIRGGDAEISLIDEAGVTETFTLAASDLGTLIEIPVVTDGEYFLGIAPVDAVSVDYSIDVRFPGPDDGPQDFIDNQNIFDAPDTPLEAPTISVGNDTEFFSGSVSDADPGDVFAFVVEDDVAINIEIVSPNGQVFGSLYDANEEFIAPLWPLEGTNFGGDFIDVIAGETYFIELAGATSDDIYGVSLTAGAAHVPPPPSTDDVSLPNGDVLWSDDVGGTLGTSTLLPLDHNGNLTALGSLGYSDELGITDDADFYRFVATVDGLAAFTIESDTEVYDFMTLYDAAGVPFSGSEGGGFFTETLIAGEVYTLEIPHGSDGAGDYTLNIDAPAPAPFEERSDGVGLGDAGNTLASPLDIALSGAGDAVIRGSIGIGGDTADVFRFIPAESGDLEIFIGDDFQTGVSATLLDVVADSSVESFAVPFFGGEEIGPLAVTAGQEYLITVSADHPVPSLYTLTVNAPTALSPIAGDDLVDGVSIGDAPSDLDSSHSLDLASQDRFVIEGVMSGFLDFENIDILDNFSFTAPMDATLAITLEDVLGNFESSLAVTTYELVDGEISFVGGFTSQGPNDAIRPLRLNVEAGKDYLVTASALSGSVSYTLTIDAAPDALEEGEETETRTSPMLAPVDLPISYIEDDDIGNQFSPNFLTIGPASGIGGVTGSVGVINEFGIADTDSFFFTSPDDALSIATISLDGAVLDDGESLSARIYSGNDRFVGTLPEPGSVFELYAGIDENYYIEVLGTSDGPLDYTLSLDFRDAGTNDIDFGQLMIGDRPASTEAVVPLTADISFTERFTEFTGNVGADDDTADFIGVQSSVDATLQATLKVRGGDARVTVMQPSQGSEEIIVPDGNNAVFDIPVSVGDIPILGIEALGEGSIDYSWDLSIPGIDDGPLDVVDGELVFDAPLTLFEAPVADFRDSPSMLSGSLTLLDWADSYALLAPQPGGVLYEFNSSSGRIAGTIINFDSSFLDSFDAFPGTTFGGGHIEVAADDSYFLELRSLSFATELYDVYLSAGAPHSPPQGTADEVSIAGDAIPFFDDDAGDSLGQSTLTPLDVNGDLSVAGHLGVVDGAQQEDQADFYRFVATANGRVDISLDTDVVNDEGFDVPIADSLMVYDATGNEIAFETNYGGSALLSLDLVAGEVYVVAVPGVSGVSGEYSLLVDAPAPISTEERVGYDRLGDGGTGTDDALALTLSDAGDTVVLGSTGFSGDTMDTFRITAAASGPLSILLSDDFQTPLMFSVLDIASGEIYFGGAPITLDGRASSLTDFDVEAGKDYLITVEPQAPLPGRYTLTINAPTLAPPVTGDDAVDGSPVGEAATDLVAATSLTLSFAGDAVVAGALLGSAGGDSADSYSFTAPASGTIVIMPQDVITDNDSAIRVDVFSAEDAGPANESVLFPSGNSYIQPLELDVTAGDEYIIQVSSDAASASYTLDLDAPGGPLDFIPLDRLGDGLLYDADFLLDSGELISAADAQLYRTYGGALGRIPDVGGFDWWSNQIAIGNHDLDSMVAGFIWSPEFLSFFPGAERPIDISSADFVTHMYENVFGRPPDAGGFAFWTGVLDNGTLSQARVVVEMTQSNEFIGLNANPMIEFLI